MDIFDHFGDVSSIASGDAPTDITETFDPINEVSDDSHADGPYQRYLKKYFFYCVFICRHRCIKSFFICLKSKIIFKIV